MGREGLPSPSGLDGDDHWLLLTWGSWSLTFILVSWRVLTLLRAMDGMVWKGFETGGHEPAWCHLMGSAEKLSWAGVGLWGGPRSSAGSG